MLSKMNKKGQIAEAKNKKFLLSTIYPKSSRGQIAETMTWVVATIIVVVTLVVFIFISVSLSNPNSLKNIASKTVESFTGDDVGDVSRLKIKSEFAFSLDERNKEVINNWLNDAEK